MSLLDPVVDGGRANARSVPLASFHGVRAPIYSPDDEARLSAAISVLGRHLRRPHIINAHSALLHTYLRIVMHGLPYQRFDVLCVDRDGRLRTHRALFRGTVNVCVVYPREVARYVLAHHGGAVVIAHRATARSEPTDAQRRVERSLSGAVEAVGGRVLDFCIVDDDRVVGVGSQGDIQPVPLAGLCEREWDIVSDAEHVLEHRRRIPGPMLNTPEAVCAHVARAPTPHEPVLQVLMLDTLLQVVGEFRIPRPSAVDPIALRRELAVAALRHRAATAVLVHHGHPDYPGAWLHDRLRNDCVDALGLLDIGVTDVVVRNGTSYRSAYHDWSFPCVLG